MGAKRDTPECSRLDVLIALVEVYEASLAPSKA